MLTRWILSEVGQRDSCLEDIHWDCQMFFGYGGVLDDRGLMTTDHLPIPAWRCST
jgi:hypothetical protein